MKMGKSISTKKAKCWRIGCNREADEGILCKKHESERRLLNQTLNEYIKKNCVDKSSEFVKVAVSKKKHGYKERK